MILHGIHRSLERRLRELEARLEALAPPETEAETAAPEAAAPEAAETIDTTEAAATSEPAETGDAGDKTEEKGE